MSTKLKAAVVMGSDSDYPILKNCIKTLKQFEIETEIHVISAHRTLSGGRISGMLKTV